MLVHQRKDDGLDEFDSDPGWAAYMSSNSFDWPTALVKVGHSLIQSVIIVPYREVLAPTNHYNTTSDVVIFLRSYLDDIPKSAELQYQKLN